MLHIDLGDISENVIETTGQVFYQNDLNDEDYITNSNYVDSKWETFLGNGILNFSDDDQGEDVGLDGCPDAYEDGLGGCLDDADPTRVDPNGDNWSFKYWGSYYDYSRINGTEYSRTDAEANPRPDSEDINGDGALDKANDYVSYAIPLNGFSRYEVEGSREVRFRLRALPDPHQGTGRPGRGFRRHAPFVGTYHQHPDVG